MSWTKWLKEAGGVERSTSTFDVGKCRQTTSRLGTGVAPLESTGLFSPPGEICGKNTDVENKYNAQTYALLIQDS